MRRALRIYISLSCVGFSLLAAGVAVLGGLYVVSPASLERLWKMASAEITIRSDPARESKQPAAASADPAQSSPPPAKASPVSAAIREPGIIDVPALERRLKHLEGAAPSLAVPRTSSAGKPEPSCLEQLDAWESLREPLLELLNSVTGPGCGERALSGAEGIEALAPMLSARLRAISSDWNVASRRLAGGFSPTTLARLLLDETALPDSRALVILRRLEGEGAREAIERLTRWAPRRAARLLVGLSTESDRNELGSPLETEPVSPTPSGSGVHVQEGHFDG